jgi:hypothetical protein
VLRETRPYGYLLRPKRKPFVNRLPKLTPDRRPKIARRITNKLPLTHEFLSLMLGVRRSGVTQALHVLRNRALISYGRGQITVNNREGLERVAGDAYGIPESEYRRLIGWGETREVVLGQGKNRR